MTQPIAPAYQSTPWQPTIDTSAAKAELQDEQQAAAQYTSIYGGSPLSSSHPASSPPGEGAVVPSLSVAYTDSPHLVPIPGKIPNNGAGLSGAVAEAFSIELGTLRASEQTCLNATAGAVDGYETLKSTVTSAINSSTIFGQNAAMITANGRPSPAAVANGPASNLDPLDSEGQQFAASIDPQMEKLLYHVGAVIEAMGQFNAMLNNAGQMYTEADYNSAFPA